MVTYDDAIDKAREIGGEHGENAAAWWEQETRVFLSSPPNVAMMIQGLDDGDPIVLDNLPAPDLSGEWADGYTPMILANQTGVSLDNYGDWIDALCDAYENGFSEAVETAVRAACENALSE